MCYQALADDCGAHALNNSGPWKFKNYKIVDKLFYLVYTNEALS